MRQSQVGSENSGVEETLLKMINGQADPQQQQSRINNLDIAVQMIMQDLRITCRQIAEGHGKPTQETNIMLTTELGFCKVGSSSFDTWTEQVHCVQGQYWAVWSWWRQFPCSIQQYGWKLRSLLPTRNQRTIKPIEAHVISDPKEGQGRSFSWLSHGLGFLRFPGYHTERILREGPYSDRTALFWTTEALRELIKEKRPGMLTRGILFHQGNAPAYISGLPHNSSSLWILACFPSTLFARPARLQLPSFRSNESLGWSPFCQWWWRHSRVS